MNTCKLSVADGVVLVSSETFRLVLIGSSCETTLPPSMPSIETPFRVFPMKKEKTDTADLVLLRAEYKGENGKVYWVMLHIKRNSDDGHIKVVENPIKVEDLVGAKVNFQILGDGTLRLQAGKVIFTTNPAAVAAIPEGLSVMVAGTDDLLRYIAGHISRRDLRTCAKRTERGLKLEEMLKVSEAGLRRERQLRCQAEGDARRLQVEVRDLSERLAQVAA